MKIDPRKTVSLCLAVLLTGALSAGAEGVLADWDKGLNVGLNLTDGNSDTLGLNAGILAERGAPEDDSRCALGFVYNYGETEDVRTVDNQQVFAKHREVLTGNTYGYASISWLRDDIAAIDYRVIVGAGLGQYLVRNETTALGVEFGLAWIAEDVADVDVDVFALRFAQNLEHRFSDTARIVESVEYLPEANDFDNYLLNAEIAAEADMNEKILLRLAVQNRYDSTPAPGLEHNDVAVVAGLGYKL